MKTNLENLIELVNRTFESHTLSASRATEWLNEFGYEACVTAIKLTAEVDCRDPLAYTFGILKKEAAKQVKPKAHPSIPREVIERYYQLVENGDLTADEMNLLIDAKSGKNVDANALFEAQFSLRKALYSNSRMWIPESATLWQKLCWYEMDESQRRTCNLQQLRLAADYFQNHEAASQNFKSLSQLIDYVAHTPKA